MNLNLWSILLIASASQCVFLGVIFALRPPANKKAMWLLVTLLFLILAVNINNIWYAGYLYRTIDGVAGFARGMTLLLGPLLYFYVQAIVKPDFKFRPIHLLHLLPYLGVFLLLLLQSSELPSSAIVGLIDALMNGELEVDAIRIARFLLYVVHLLGYLMATRYSLAKTMTYEDKDYLVSLNARAKWLKKLTVYFFVLAMALVGLTIYMLLTNTYTIVGNFVLTLIMSAIVYLIAYQALLNNAALLPDFSAKYGASRLKTQLRDSLLQQLLHLLEQEKVYTDPNLKIGSLAKQLDTQPHILSQVINHHLNKSFFELLNQYRIEEFKRRARDPQFNNHSILGIAYDVGYNSKSTFYTAFKKHTGLTPSEYIKSS